MTVGGIANTTRTVKVMYSIKAQIPLGSSRHVSTRHDPFDVSSSCILAVLSLSNSTAQHSHLDVLDTSDVSCRDVTNQMEFGLNREMQT